MSLTRRLAAGLPVVGLTLFAALAIGNALASAAPGDAARGVKPIAAASPSDDGYSGTTSGGRPGSTSPTSDDHRGHAGYGSVSPTTSPPTTPPTTAPTTPPTIAPTTPPTTAPPTTPPTTPPTVGATTGTTTAPTPTGPTPTGNTDTVPPGGGVSPTTWSPPPPPRHHPHQHRGHASGTPGGTLPLTGAPTAGIAGMGAALVGTGALALWFSRRRRDA
jgi:LPXTG-motif cell wall-anchored protein